MSAPLPPPERRARLLRRVAVACGIVLVAGAAVALSESRPAWSALTPAQRQALAPLERDWPAIEPARKQKWLEVAARFPILPADERQRVQERMRSWASLTPNERARARLQFQEARQISPEERQARWQAYQSLPEDERHALAQKEKARRAGKTHSRAAASQPAPTLAKSNVIVPTRTPPPRPVAPTVMQAKPGATTTTMSTRAAPPPHHQPGLPKIVATPGFVDPATLLPKRGPQGAAVRAAASSDPTRQP